MKKVLAWLKEQMGGLLAVLQKECLHIKRDKRTLSMIILMPLLQLMLYGYAINTDLKHLNVAVWDEDNSSLSRSYIEAIVQSQYFDVQDKVYSQPSLRQKLDRGEVKAALHIPSDFSQRLHRKEPVAVSFLIDGSDSTPANTALGNIGVITAAFENRLLDQKPSFIDVKARLWYNPDLKSSFFIIPGLIGLLLQLLVAMITASAIVREKERGTIEQLLVTPLSRFQMIGGKIIPYLIIGLVIISLILSAPHLLFEVPVRGHLWTLVLMTFLFISVCLSLGLLVSTLSDNQQQSAQMIMFLAAPSILLSGFLFPREAMPLPIQVLS
jgi:ABC-2 type transport system permease protein